MTKTIEVGEMQQFVAMALTSDGDPVPDAEFAWKSSNQLAAMVDQTGLANSCRPGRNHDHGDGGQHIRQRDADGEPGAGIGAGTGAGTRAGTGT